MQLTGASITEAALDILRQYGLADVTMRRVATSLGVAPGALYWHIANKQALIASLAEAIVAPVLAPGTDDPEALCALFYSCALDIRDGAEVVVTALGYPDASLGTALTQRFEEVVEARVGNVASMSNKRAAASGLLHMTLGAAAVEQAGAQLAQLTGESATRSEHDHATAVRLLLNGLCTPRV